MKIEIDQLLSKETRQYPYTHRVKVVVNWDEAEQIDNWLEESGIKYANPGRGVYYLGRRGAISFMLRFA